MVTFPGDTYFPDIDLTYSGIPSDIVCGQDSVAAGTVVLADVVANPSNGTTPAPDPPVPFAGLSQDKYACLIHSGDTPFCLPPGTYHQQSGKGFEITKVDSLTLPNEGKDGAWSLQVHYTTKKKPTTVDRNYNHNEDPVHKPDDWQQFSVDMHGIAEENDGSFTIIGPNDGSDPVCCLFSDTSFGGNV